MASTDNSPRGITISSTGLDGPDQILPSNVDRTTEASGRVRIKYDNLSPNEIISIPGLLTRIAKKFPNQTALVSCPGVNERRKTWTYKEYETDVITVAKAFLKLGLKRYYSVGIIGFNSPQWFISKIAAIYAGGIASGIYATNSPDACYHCAETSRVNILVVEDAIQLDKVLKIKSKLTHLKAIIQYDGTPETKGVYSWDEVLKIGRTESKDKLDEVLKTIGVNECCSLVYTSGTVGNPKAVMLSHDNLIYNATETSRRFNFAEAQELLISFLPLSHIAAQVSDIYSTMRTAATVYFADKYALKGTLLQTLVAVRPTVFTAVPRVWEKIYDKMIQVESNNGTMKTWLVSLAKTQGLKHSMDMIHGIDYKNWGYVIVKWLIFDRVKASLGLDRCKYSCSLAAILSNDIKKYFMSLDIPLMEGYGLSETSAAHTMGSNHHFRLGSIGTALEGHMTKLDNTDSTGEGEICMAGRHIFMGYLNEPEKTKEIVDKDGWLHSGDLGRIDSEGFVYITGRIKEIVITAGGENVPPVRIEHTLLAELPALNNAMLVGDMRKFLTILVTLKTDVDPVTGTPLDTLNDTSRTWAASIGSTAKTVTEILQTRDPAIYKEIEEAIKRANTHATSNAQKVQKFQILPRDFSIPTGELGPTMKLRRNIVAKKYANLIDEMYK